uniref:SIAH-type domain-containing protein n=1 Tax=Triticum aestivum TaxID=4565 RepID=A0A077RPE8_WHEAT|nr:unnamed protein product [Triticum aestivum]
MVDECLLLTAVVMVVVVWLLGIDDGCSVVFFGVRRRCFLRRREAICFPSRRCIALVLCSRPFPRLPRWCGKEDLASMEMEMEMEMEMDGKSNGVTKCAVGHFVCLNCRDKLLETKENKVWGVCSRDVSTRCHDMERVVDSIIVPCSYAVHGCGDTIAYHKKRAHEEGHYQASTLDTIRSTSLSDRLPTNYFLTVPKACRGGGTRVVLSVTIDTEMVYGDDDELEEEDEDDESYNKEEDEDEDNDEDEDDETSDEDDESYNNKEEEAQEDEDSDNHEDNETSDEDDEIWEEVRHNDYY